MHHLAALLSARALARVRAALGSEHEVSHADGWPELSSLVRRVPVSLAIIDPRLSECSAIDALRVLRHDFPSLPLLLHLPMTLPAMQTLAELAHEGFHNVVIEPYEDDTASLRAQVASLMEHELEEHLLAMLRPILEKAPAGITAAVSRLFREPHSFGSVDDMATVAGMPRRTFDRNLHALGLAPGHRLLTVARVLRVYKYSRDPGYNLAHIAEKVGYSDPVVLARQIRTVTGETPAEWRRHATKGSVISQLSVLLFSDGMQGILCDLPPRQSEVRLNDSHEQPHIAL